MPKMDVLPDAKGCLTLAQFRKYTKRLPGKTRISPRFLRDMEDEDPSVMLLGFGTEQYEDGKVLVIGVDLRPLDAHFECDNCGRFWAQHDLKDSPDLYERMDPGGPMPAGDCPDCGAFCYDTRPPEERD